MMITDKTTYLGDGVYVGLDMNGINQFWLGANHHENMTVAMGPSELIGLIMWLRYAAPHILKEAGVL